MKPSDELLQIFYDWDRIEKGKIIDFDLIGRKKDFPQKYSTRQEVRKVLQQSIKLFEGDSSEERFIRAKIGASIAYLDALEGKNIPFRRYIETTMGITPRIFPTRYIDAWQAKVHAAYRSLGYEYTKKGLEVFIRENTLGKDIIRSSFIKFRDTWLSTFLEWQGIRANIDYEIKFVDEDVYWMNWISTNVDGKIVLRYNIHKRHTWLRGVTEYLVLHEICGHLVQMISWKEKIRRGEMNPFVGLTSTFTQEQFLGEGIAQTISDFIPYQPLSEYGKRALLADQFYWMVMNNLHVMANAGTSKNEMFLFVNKYLPRYSMDKLVRDVKEKTKDPLMRTYQYIYGISLYYFSSFASTMNSMEKRKFVKSIYSQVTPPRDLIRHYLKS